MITQQATDTDGAIWIEVHGNLDAQSASELRERVRTVVADTSGQRIILDMNQVPFMDSTGLAALISGLKSVRQNDGWMALANVTPGVMRIFQITLLDRAFTFI